MLVVFLTEKLFLAFAKTYFILFLLKEIFACIYAASFARVCFLAVPFVSLPDILSDPYTAGQYQTYSACIALVPCLMQHLRLCGLPCLQGGT